MERRDCERCGVRYTPEREEEFICPDCRDILRYLAKEPRPRSYELDEDDNYV